jgi:hypothetical protein
MNCPSQRRTSCSAACVDIRASAEKKSHGIDVITTFRTLECSSTGSSLQRGKTPFASRVDIGAAIEKQLDGIFIKALGCGVQCGGGGVRCVGGLCTFRQKQFDKFFAPAIRSYLQRCWALINAYVDVGTLGNEPLDKLPVASPNRVMKWRTAGPVWCVDIRPSGNEELCHLHVAIHRGHVKRRNEDEATTPRVHIGTLVKERLHPTYISRSRGIQQGLSTRRPTLMASMKEPGQYYNHQACPK